MEPRLRHYISVRLMLSIMASGILAGGAVILAGTLLIEDIVDDATSIAFREIENRLSIMEAILSRIERDASEAGFKALAMLEAQYPSIEEAMAAGMDTLKNDAERLGVDEVYFISNDGIIAATSFEPDVGFNLFSLGTNFVGRLRQLIGSGRFENLRISISTRTSHANSYQFHGPDGADFIIEVSTRLDRAIARTFPGYELHSLLKLLFNTGYEGNDYIVKATDVLWGLNPPYRSFISEQPIDPELQIMVRDASLSDGLWTEPDGKNTIIVRQLKIKNEELGIADQGLFVVFSVRTSLSRDFIISSVALSGFLILTSIVLSFFLTRKSFDKRVTSRLETLETAMSKVAAGDEETSLDDGMTDEIASIGRSAENMVAQIRERNTELLASHAANHALIHELDHRVHNNLQFAMSLASMQSRTTESTATKDALERMRSRLTMMSMVQDHAIKKSDFPDIDMTRIFYDICAEISGYHGYSTAGIKRWIEVEDLFLDTETAIAIGLVAAEIIDNAYRHAFKTSKTGTLSIRSEKTDDSLAFTFDDDGEGVIDKVSVGLELALALSDQLGGSLTWQSGEGHRVLLTIPLA